MQRACECGRGQPRSEPAAAAGRQAVTPAVTPGELGWAHWFRPGTTVTPFGGFGIDVTLCLAGLEPRGNDQQG